MEVWLEALREVVSNPDQDTQAVVAKSCPGFEVPNDPPPPPAGWECAIPEPLSRLPIAEALTQLANWVHAWRLLFEDMDPNSIIQPPESEENM
jgi:hypothetical protein